MSTLQLEVLSLVCLTIAGGILSWLVTTNGFIIIANMLLAARTTYKTLKYLEPEAFT